MKALVVAIIFLWVGAVVQAAPFLTCTPQAGALTYKLTGPYWVTPEISAKADGALALDLGNSAVGISDIKVQACNSSGCGPEMSITLYKTYSIGHTGKSKTPTLRYEWWVVENGEVTGSFAVKP